MPFLHLEIVGMICEHCVRAVRHRLASTAGVEVTDVTIGTADIRYDPSKISTGEIEDAVSDEGYTVDTISELAR
jgi:copper chaperone